MVTGGIGDRDSPIEWCDICPKITTINTEIYPFFGGKDMNYFSLLKIVFG